MRGRSNTGFVIVLAGVLLLNVTGVCSALLPHGSRTGHVCCPTHEPPVGDALTPRCCIAPAAPVIPAAASFVPPVWVAPAMTVPPASGLSRSQAPLAPHPYVASPRLFLKFKQFLI